MTTKLSSDILCEIRRVAETGNLPWGATAFPVSPQEWAQSLLDRLSQAEVEVSDNCLYGYQQLQEQNGEQKHFSSFSTNDAATHHEATLLGRIKILPIAGDAAHGTKNAAKDKQL